LVKSCESIDVCTHSVRQGVCAIYIYVPRVFY